MKRSDIQLIDSKQIDQFGSRALLIKPDISPYLAYLVLKDWFGLPDKEEDESKVQWNFYLTTLNLAIHVYDWKLEELSIEIFRKHPDFEDVEKEANEFIQLLEKQTSKYTSKIKSMASSKEKVGTIYRNPFALYFNGAENILKKAREWENAELTKESWELSQFAKELYRAAFFLYIASFEGLLNIIYEIYLNPHLRDERIYEHLKREQIDIKLRLAPLYCICFKSQKVFDNTTEEFRRFQAIVNLRNDFVHANITKSMTTPVIEEDGFTFTVPSEDKDKYSLSHNPAALSYDNLKFVRDSIQDIIRVILKSMKPRYRREFFEVMYDETINIEIEDEEFIVI